MNICKKIFILSIIVSCSLQAMNSESASKVKILPEVEVYFDSDALNNIHNHTIKNSDGTLSYTGKLQSFVRNMEHRKEIFAMCTMSLDHKKVNAYNLIRDVAKYITLTQYCNGYNTARKEYSFWRPLFFGVGIGAGTFGIAWWLKSKGYW